MAKIEIELKDGGTFSFHTDADHTEKIKSELLRRDDGEDWGEELASALVYYRQSKYSSPSEL